MKLVALEKEDEDRNGQPTKPLTNRTKKDTPFSAVKASNHVEVEAAVGRGWP